MEHAAGEAVVVIDADLQDPPELIPEMLKKWREGYDVVYGKRLERKGETFFKKFTAGIFYRFLKHITDMDIPVDTGDFRLIGKNVCDALKQINERNRYVRGIIAWLGFRQTGIEFVRDKRFAGETKYPLKKMLKFAFDAISSFSYKPLKLASYIGFFISMVSFLYLIVVLYQGLFSSGTAPGWASTLAVSLFFNGIVLIILGIIGGYLGRIYDEAKGRPLYIVRQMTNFGLQILPEESSAMIKAAAEGKTESKAVVDEKASPIEEIPVSAIKAETPDENNEAYEDAQERKLFKDKLKPSPG
jgi:dolichol-phosphate mannosyltransferase